MTLKLYNKGYFRTERSNSSTFSLLILGKAYKVSNVRKLP